MKQIETTLDSLAKFVSPEQLSFLNERLSLVRQFKQQYAHLLDDLYRNQVSLETLLQNGHNFGAYGKGAFSTVLLTDTHAIKIFVRNYLDGSDPCVHFITDVFSKKIKTKHTPKVKRLYCIDNGLYIAVMPRYVQSYDAPDYPNLSALHHHAHENGFFGDGTEDLHSGNVMWDSKKERWVITDPCS